MKNGRLFELLYLLVERRALTAGELAERFEVSERTIYRDVDALSAAGVPVYTQRGQGGGIRLMDQFVLDRCLLSPREQDEVLFALRALLSTGGLEGAEALERLSALFRREAEGWVEVDFTGAYSTVIVVQQDKPGVVAHITKVLSDNGVNIAFMRLFREAKGHTAYTIVESDGHLPEGVDVPLRNNPNVQDVMLLEP